MMKGLLMDHTIKELRGKARSLKPTVYLGKEGLTQTVITEIKNQLKARKLVKIRILQSAGNGRTKKDLADQLAQSTGSTLVDAIGHVIVLYCPSVA